MASIYDLKPKFQALLRPMCKGLADAGITANHVTLAALILSVAYGGAVAFASAHVFLILLPLLLFIRMAMNAIDGMLAREFGQKSDLGAILNELSDVVADAVLYLPFALIAGTPAALIVVVVVLAIIAEMTGVVAVMIGSSRRYDGPFGKSDRAVFFGALGLALGFGVNLEAWISWLFLIAIVLSMLTIANRARAALKEGEAVRHG